MLESYNHYSLFVFLGTTTSSIRAVRNLSYAIQSALVVKPYSVTKSTKNSRKPPSKSLCYQFFFFLEQLVYNQVSKPVCDCRGAEFAVACWWKKDSHYFSTHKIKKLEPITVWSLAFSCTLGRLEIFTDKFVINLCFICFWAHFCLRPSVEKLSMVEWIFQGVTKWTAWS